MKALFFDKPEKPVVSQVQSPSITANEVMIRSRRVGICHSDYELLAGHYIIPISYPVIPGHEWVGEVVEVGKNVTGLKPGDRVVGECVIKTPERIHHFGFSMDGANREYFPARPEWLHKLPDAVDDAKGAMIEPFTCGFYAVLRNGAPNASETVVISGGGPIGLVAAAAAIGMGARVIVVDPVPLRRDIAKRLGADATVDPSAGDPGDGGAGVDPRWSRPRRRGVGPFRLACEPSSTMRGRRAAFRWSESTSAQDPDRTRQDPDEKSHRSGLHRVAGRLARRDPVSRTDRNRSLADPDPQLPARRCVESV